MLSSHAPDNEPFCSKARLWQPRPVTYPPLRYAGSTGEHSATYRPAAQPAELTTPNAAVRYLATGASTDGAFGLYRWSMTQRRSGPAAHFHRTISESFYVLSGDVQLYDGRDWVGATAGDFLHVPPGGVHAFRNESGAPADLLILFTPGAPREQYFEALAELMASGRKLSPEEETEFLARHDQYTA